MGPTVSVSEGEGGYRFGRAGNLGRGPVLASGRIIPCGLLTIFPFSFEFLFYFSFVILQNISNLLQFNF
jgi:hypothetical protein